MILQSKIWYIVKLSQWQCKKGITYTKTNDSLKKIESDNFSVLLRKYITNFAIF